MKLLSLFFASLLIAFPAIASNSLENVDSTVFLIVVFVLAIFVGYFVVWSVTPALHTPLMSVTNAISAITIVGAVIVAATSSGEIDGRETWTARGLGTVAVFFASVNIVGGFLVTRRMLAMYRKKSQ